MCQTLPTITLYLGFNSKGEIEATEFRGSRDREPTIVRTMEEITAIGNGICEREGYEEADLEFMCSSSIDFPNEYTADPVLLSLCREIRG